MPHRRVSGAGPPRPPRRSPRCRRWSARRSARAAKPRTRPPWQPQVHLFRSAALTGASQTAARSGTLMKKHNALARRLLGRQDDYLRFTTDWRIPPDNDQASHCTSWVRSVVPGFRGGQVVLPEWC